MIQYKNYLHSIYTELAIIYKLQLICREKDVCGLYASSSQKGFGHPKVLVSNGGTGINPRGYQGTTV
jgi:hypothetical protein